MNTIQEFNSKSDLITHVIDNLPSAIIVLTPDTSIVMSNKIAQMFANKSPLDLFGLRGGEAFDCIHHTDHPDGCGSSNACRHCIVRNTVEHTIRTKENMANIEAPISFSDKGDRILSLATTWLDENELVIVALNDITEMKQRDTIKLENTKLQSAIKTSGAVCHEMNQPLAVINGYIELLDYDIYSMDEIRPCLKIIQEQVLNLGHITTALMNLTSFKEKNYLNDTILDINLSSEKHN